MDESQIVEVPVSSAPTSTVESGTNEVITTPNTSISDGSNVSNTNTASTQTSSTQELNDGTQRNLDAERGKISTLERERNQLAKERDEALSSFQMINQVYAQSPTAYEAFRQDYKARTGTDLGDHSTRYGISQQQQPTQVGQQTNDTLNNQNPGIVNQQPQAQIDPQLIAQQAAQTATQQVIQRMDIDSGINKFLEVAPELSLNGLNDPAEAQRRQEVFNRVGSSAAFFKKTYPDKFPTWDSALKYAYDALPERMEQRVNTAQEEGQMIGKAQAFASGAAQTSGVSGSTVQNRNGQTMKVSMNDIQQRKYKEFLAENPERAARYAQNIANLQKK